MAKSDRHFKTTALQANLKQRSIQSGLISIATQPIKLMVGIGGTMVLARLLVPADFGLLAMVQPLMTMVDSLSNLGLETATIQQQELDRDRASAIFWLSLKINTLVIGVMILAAPLLVWFYKRPELINIVLCLAIGATSLCLSFQHLSLLKRQMQFEYLTIIELTAMSVGAVVAILTAWLGWGYWALVLQITVMQITKGIACWVFCDWRPHRLPSESFEARQSLRSALSYGIHLTGFRFISRVGMQMDRILLGYFGGASSLGFYSVAYQWAYFPFWQIYYPLFDVAVSSFSRSLYDPMLYRTYCRRTLMLVFSLCMPALAYAFVNTKDITLFILGEQWLEIVPMFRCLLLAVFVGGLYRVTKWIYVSSGETKRQLFWSFIHTPIMIASVAIGVNWGALGVAAGYATGMCLLSYPSVVFCVKNSPITLSDFMGSVWRPMSASSISAFLLHLLQVNVFSFESLIVSLSVSSLSYALIYIFSWLILPGGYLEIKNITNLLLEKR